MKPLTGLYAITIEGVHGEALFYQAHAALSGGSRILQFRDKSSNALRREEEAQTLLTLCRKHDAILIINDDLELCLQSGAHGVHLGRDDPDLKLARKRLGADKIIGVSSYNDLRLAHDAVAGGADYVAFGAIYPSSTKPSAVNAGLALLRQAKTELDTPIVAIGGITPENALPVIQAGADMLAMIQGLFGQDNIQLAASKVTRLFENY
jgi:thiamine-phosphate pyrophosphorylase